MLQEMSRELGTVDADFCDRLGFTRKYQPRDKVMTVVARCRGFLDLPFQIELQLPASYSASAASNISRPESRSRRDRAGMGRGRTPSTAAAMARM